MSMSMLRRTLAAMTSAATALLIGGCLGGLHSNQPQQQVFLLNLPATGGAPTSAVATAAPADALMVLAPSTDPGLGGEGIAVMRAGERLDYYSGARWASDAQQMLQSLMVEAFRRQGHFALVETDGGAFDARYVLSTEVTHFEASYGESGAPTVQVTLVCTLGRRGDRSVVTTLRVNGSVEARADRMGAVVEAFEQATDQVVARVAEQMVPPAAGVP